MYDMYDMYNTRNHTVQEIGEDFSNIIHTYFHFPIYIYVCVCVYVCMCSYMYVYVWRSPRFINLTMINK